MLKYIFIFVTLFHGLIHFMGFAKAYNYGNITQMTKEISKPIGIVWLATGFLFGFVLFQKSKLVIFWVHCNSCMSNFNHVQLERCKVWNYCKHHNFGVFNCWIFPNKF